MMRTAANSSAALDWNRPVSTRVDWSRLTSTEVAESMIPEKQARMGQAHHRVYRMGQAHHRVYPGGSVICSSHRASTAPSPFFPRRFWRGKKGEECVAFRAHPNPNHASTGTRPVVSTPTTTQTGTRPVVSRPRAIQKVGAEQVPQRPAHRNPNQPGARRASAALPGTMTHLRTGARRASAALPAPPPNASTPPPQEIL